MAKSERLEVRVDADVLAMVGELAALRKVTASVVVRRLIRDAYKLAFPDAPTRPCKPVLVEAPTPPPNTLADFHAHLWDRPPSPIQRVLYERRARGFLGGATEEHLDAVITMALYIAPLRPDTS